MKKKEKLNIKKNKKTIIFFIAFTLFIILTYIIFSNRISTIDSYIESLIMNIRNDNLTNIMIVITNLSGAYFLVVISILLLALIKEKKYPIMIIINLTVSFLLSQLVKLIIQRPRPTGINLIYEAGYSYPSGHSMVSMAYFGFLAYLIYKKIPNKIAKIFLIILALTTTTLIGFSRIYLGVHYFSDVIGGFLLSIAYLMFFINLNKPYIEGAK